MIATYCAETVGHPYVAAKCYAETPYAALQALFKELEAYAGDQARCCAEFWTPDEVMSDYNALGRVEGWCGAFTWKCQLLPPKV